MKLNKHVAIFIICGFTFISSLRAEISFGFSQHWHDQTIPISQYQQLYIDALDLRDISIKTIDQDGNASKKAIGETNIEELAYKLFDAFAKAIAPTIPVNTEEIDTKKQTDKKSLALDIKISMQAVIEEQGLLMNLLTKNNGQAQPVDTISIECTLRDIHTDKKIISLNDQQEILFRDRSNPFGSKHDIEAFEKLAGVWAKRIANFIAQQKKPL